MTNLHQETNKYLQTATKSVSKKTSDAIDHFIDLIVSKSDVQAAVNFCCRQKYNTEFNNEVFMLMNFMISNKDIDLTVIDELFEIYHEQIDVIEDEMKGVIEYLSDINKKSGGHQTFPDLGAQYVSIIDGEVVVEILFRTEHSAAIWSRTKINIKEVVMFSFAMHIIGMRINRDDGSHVLFETVFNNRKEPAKSKPCPLFKYHPERFKQSRTYSRLAFDPSSRRAMIDYGAYTSMESIQLLSQDVIAEYNHKNMLTPLKSKVQLASDTSQMINDEITLFTQIAQFLQAGKQIFDFSKGLINLFKESDVNDIPLEYIKLPYDAMYLHFGKQNIEVAEEWFFEGAYVSYQEDLDLLSITITSLHDDIERNLNWSNGEITTYTVNIPNARSKKDLALAITEAAAAQIAGIRDGLASQGKVIEVDDISVINAAHEHKDQRIEAIKTRNEIFERAIKLIVNAICYLSTYSEDRVAKWPAKAPEKLVKKTKDKNKKEASKARKKLIDLGYTKVYHIEPNQEQSSAAGASLDKSVHWRKGHWRNQPYGPKSTLRKLIWILPTLINRTSPDDESMKGHIYKN